MAKEKGRQKEKGMKGRKKSLRLAKESEMERAKANASLWETRLEVTELSRMEYRDASRRLARENEELKRQQYKTEKDTVSVLSYLKKQDSEKGDLIEKLKQQLVDAKKQAQEENEKLEESYSRQLNELTDKFHQKAKEIGLIQLELKTIKDFRKKKLQVERELEELKENMKTTKKKHQETVRRLEGKFSEEKQRLEKEAEKKIVMLAERAHQEAVLQLDTTGRSVFKENVRLQKALKYHIKEAQELQKNSKKLEENHASLLQLKETNELLVQEKVLQVSQQKSQIRTLQRKVASLETALGHVTREFETEIHDARQEARRRNREGRVEIDKLQYLLEVKDREMERVKRLARNVLDQRSDVETFFLEALQQVRREIQSSRKNYRQAARAAFQRKMREAHAGKTEYPQIRTFDDREDSTNSVHRDLTEAERWTNVNTEKVDIGDLTWEQKEKVLRLLFAKMNCLPLRRYSRCSAPPVPERTLLKAREKKRAGDEGDVPDQTFITQRAPVSESPAAGSSLPDIRQVAQPSTR
ncbi:basal body-orientation factor 1 isoform X1 [Ornithorhynchus anatinus]|uniref:basal body-orientation factor 1 isoform X1 n=1 Tax=Ornithorhynchus anatinus TaxID=9258 RepID=UPI0010A82284|nr:basal body-orientation factor 1 isoform X1 [Ornithorhynchus anatinus]